MPLLEDAATGVLDMERSGQIAAGSGHLVDLGTQPPGSRESRQAGG